MKVFKFGGGILHSAEAVKKIPGIIKMFPGEPIIIVVSAFGKTTNALEELIAARYQDEQAIQTIIGKIRDYHAEIIKGLFPLSAEPVFSRIQVFWDELNTMIRQASPKSYPEFYDQVIFYGELISSSIVSEALADARLPHFWVDARTILKTDSNFREAAIDWKISQLNADREIKPLLKKNTDHQTLIITQGFIGADQFGRSTSLGREGSDYSASIFASLLDADEVIIWKDVPGILNADPKHFRQTVKLDQISYAEATELAYYGAKVL
ncbi:MAG: aspartate kinase, partial [Bacteroidales bacterium]|nr:aspartate kinase [Bacteroidales bacterium]